MQTEIYQFLNSFKLPKVPNDYICTPTITENDVLDAISKLNTGKSPGLDGFTPDFYRIFAPYIVNLLARTFNEIFAKKSLPYSLAQAIIVLFFKKGDNCDLANYRQISLTNYLVLFLCVYILPNLPT